MLDHQHAGCRWWKKCPLRLAHSEQTLLSGERALYLFASDGFAKVQWYSALLWGAQPEGGVPRAVEQLYESFCASVRAVTTVPHLLPAVSTTRLPESGLLCQREEAV